MTTIRVTADNIIQQSVTRPGVNLGGPDRNCNCFMRHLLWDGFEPGHMESVIHASHQATATRVPMAGWEPGWTKPGGDGWPEHMWDSAEFEWLTGRNAGLIGTVKSFTFETVDKPRNVFTLEYEGGQSPQTPALFDALAVRKTFVDPTAGPPRPDSPGVASKRLKPSEQYVKYWDDQKSAIPGAPAQVILKPGTYRLSLWVMASGMHPQPIRIAWARGGTYFLGTATSTQATNIASQGLNTWYNIQREITITEGQDPVDGTLAFSIANLGTDDVFIDDLEIIRPATATNPTAFCDELVDALIDLSPGVLRWWGTQFGMSLDMMLVPPLARGPHGFEFRASEPRHISYGLRDFLGLCEYIGADPWIVVPPTWGGEDWKRLCYVLSYYAESNAIYIEFSNEGWGANSGGDPFCGASLNGGIRLGEAAESRFAAFRASPYYDADKYQLVVGGQFAVPETQRQIASRVGEDVAIAISPYTTGVVNAGDTDNPDWINAIFARTAQDVDGGLIAQTRAAIGNRLLLQYEGGWHSTRGTATPEERNALVEGPLGALVYPLYALTQMRAGMPVNCFFGMTQYAMKLSGTNVPPGFVHLWGMLRDLPTVTKRPTFLGLEMINKAIMGDMVECTVEDAKVTVFTLNELTSPRFLDLVQAWALSTGETVSVVVMNLSTVTQNVSVLADGYRYDSLDQINGVQVCLDNTLLMPPASIATVHMTKSLQGPEPIDKADRIIAILCDSFQQMSNALMGIER